MWSRLLNVVPLGTADPRASLLKTRTSGSAAAAVPDAGAFRALGPTCRTVSGAAALGARWPASGFKSTLRPGPRVTVQKQGPRTPRGH